MFKSFFKESLISIDIGFRNIKLVEVDIAKKGDLLVKNFQIVPTPRGCIKNGHIMEVNIVAENLRRILRQEKIKTSNAKIIMSGTHITSRVFLVEVQENYDLQTTVYNTLSQYMPIIDFDTHKVDYKVLEVFEENNITTIKLFVTAVLKSIVDSYVAVLENLGIKAIAADIPANTISKFFKNDIRNIDFKVSENETFAVLDFGSETTIINILKNRTLEFNKVILKGSSNIDESISAVTLQKLSESEIIKKKYGLNMPKNYSEEQNEEIHNAILGTINGIVNLIYRSFDYYQNRCHGEAVSKIYIIGGGAELLGLKHYIEKALGIPVYDIKYENISGVSFNKSLDSSKINYLINALGAIL